MAMFELNETHKQLFDMAKDFSNKVWPKAKELDETAKFPLDILKKIHRIRIIKCFCPQRSGRTRLGTFEHCLISH